MITNRTVKQANIVTALLLSRRPGISLEAIEGSPLDQLVDASAVMKQEGISLESAIVDAQASSMVANMGEGSEHDMVMEETVTDVVGVLNSSINFARHVLSPATAKVDGAVKEAIANFAPARYYVEAYHIHDLLFSDALRESIDRFSNAPAAELNSLALADIPEGDLTGMLATGMGSWDAAVSNWLASKPEGWLYEVYCRIFGGMTNTNLIPEHQQAIQRGMNGKQTISVQIGSEDFLLAGYLLASALLNKPQSGNLTGSEWRSVMSVWVQQLGRSLLIFQRYTEQRIASHLMILHWPEPNKAWVKSPEDAKIVVLGNAYNDWLKGGGSPELLIGVLFAGDDRLPVTGSVIDAKKEVYANAYQRYEQILSREVAARSGDTIRNAFVTALLLALDDATDDQLPVGVERNRLAQKVTESVDRVQNWSELDIYRTARELLALAVFGKATALHWLETIDALMDADTNLSPQEAAYIAVRDYVVKYVAGQISVKSNAAVEAV